MKKKGFTLIELLSVIIILGIILSIAVPKIINVINSSKISSIESSIKNIVKAAKSNNELDPIENTTYTISNNQFVGNQLLLGGKIPDSGTIVVNKDGDVLLGLKIDKYCATKKYETEEITITEQETCTLPISKVYGVRFKNATIGQRTDNAVGLGYTKGASTITSDFDNAEIYNEIVDVIEDGNAFVKIPRFWIKKKKNEGNIWTYQISKDKQDADYYLPAVFQDYETGKLADYVLIGKYNASLNGTKLESKSGAVPFVQTTIVNFRTYATNNNVNGITGYQLLDIHAIDLLQTLFYVEFATLDSQTIMYGYASGRYHAPDIIEEVIDSTHIKVTNGNQFRVGQLIDISDERGTRSIKYNLVIRNVTGNIIEYESVPGISGGTGTIAKDQFVYNVANINGQTDSVTTTSGSYISNTDGKYSMKYRGIENVYGNVLQAVDGINIQNYQAYVSKNPTNYTSNKFDGDYKALSYINLNVDGYPLEMGYDINNPYANFPILKASGLGTSIYKDHYYTYSGNMVAAFGGDWHDLLNNGVSYWHFNSSISDNNVLRGSRIIKKIQ